MMILSYIYALIHHNLLEPFTLSLQYKSSNFIVLKNYYKIPFIVSANLLIPSSISAGSDAV